MAAIKFARSVWCSGRLYRFNKPYEIGKDISKEDAERALRHAAAEMADGSRPGGDTVLTTENTGLTGKRPKK